jgi:hypothetical protein
MRYYESRWPVTVDGRKHHAIVRVCRRKWGWALLHGWNPSYDGPIAIGFDFREAARTVSISAPDDGKFSFN